MQSDPFEPLIVSYLPYIGIIETLCKQKKGSLRDFALYFEDEKLGNIRI
jgi:hypothetical protein